MMSDVGTVRFERAYSADGIDYLVMYRMDSAGAWVTDGIAGKAVISALAPVKPGSVYGPSLTIT